MAWERVRGKYDRIGFVVLDKAVTDILKKQVDKDFILRVAEKEIMIVQMPISRIGDLATLKGVKEVYEDEIPGSVVRSLSPEAARFATIWNWKLGLRRRRKPVSDKEVMDLMKTVGLGIINNEVVDSSTRKTIGKVEEGELQTERHYHASPGCWWLRGTNSWRVIPGFFGAWTRVCGTSEARSCRADGSMSSSRLIIDYIRVSAWNRVGAYVWRSRRDSSYVDGCDWEYVWLWEVEAGGARSSSDHYGRRGGSTISFSL